LIDWNDNQLYSNDPRIRWARAREVAKNKGSIENELANRFQNWPPFWRGSANAWLIFLGPSPGSSGTGSKPRQIPELGIPHNHFKNYKDKARFWDRIRDWTNQAYSSAGIFDNDHDAAYGISMMGNMTSQNVGDSSKISDEQLSNAMPMVFKALEQVKPRIIVTLEKRVSKILVGHLKSRWNDFIDGPNSIAVQAKNQRFSHYKPKNWEFLSPWGPLMIAESPQHPSKHNFYDDKVVDDYLAELMKNCLEKS